MSAEQRLRLKQESTRTRSRSPAKTLLQLQGQFFPERVWELCCDSRSALAAAAQNSGMAARRFNLENGYDLTKRQVADQMVQEIKLEKPTRVWASPPCTPWTSIQNLNQRTEKQIKNLYRHRQESRKLVAHVVQVFKAAILEDETAHIYFEWPRGCVGWNVPELQGLRDWLEKRGRKLHKVYMDGCAFGMTDPQGKPVLKAWTILTTDSAFQGASMRCRGDHVHSQILGMGTSAVRNTGYYPEAMARRIVQIWRGQRRKDTDKTVVYELQELDDLLPVFKRRRRDEDTAAYTPTEPERESASVLLHRLHRAAGHPTNKNLARLCDNRGMPKWIVDEALELKCQACEETKVGEQYKVPVSINARAKPWQFVGIDVFELSFPKQQLKARRGTCS